jgi:hypothetical protein
MSNNRRTSRRRRIALGLGATGGGLLAAAFMPVGIALADTTGAVAAATAASGDPGLYPQDTELSPDPFSDFTGYPDAGNAEGLLDNQINIDNPFLAAQIDYDIDNKIPFSFNTLDGIGATPANYNPDANGADLGPFTDAFANNGGTATSPLADGMTLADAQSYDYALNQLLTPTQVAGLDALADGGSSVTGTPGEPTVDPFLDALNATATAPTQTQIFEANYADSLLDTQNPYYAYSLDQAVEAAIKAAPNGILPSSAAGDLNGISDAFTNAGGSGAEGALFDTALPTVAGNVDPIVDTLGTVGTPPDLDPGADFVQIFDPTAFTVNPLTGLEVANPNDFLATLAVDYDQFVNLIPGLAAPMDSMVDSLATFLTSIGL